MLPSLYDGCASRSTPSDKLPVLQAPLSTGKAPSRAQRCSCHAWDPRRGSTTLFTLDALTFPSFPSGPGSAESTPAWLCAGYSGLQQKAAPCGRCPDPSRRQLPTALTRRRALCLWTSCGNTTARLPSPCRREPRFPSLSGGPTGCAEPQHRLLPAGSPEPAISCSVPKCGVLFLFCFCKRVIARTQSPEPVSPRGPVVIACAEIAGRIPLSPIAQAFLHSSAVGKFSFHL